MFFPALIKTAVIKKLPRGFTLIELLIVISIISILIAVGTVSYSSVQMKGRDAKRKANLAQISQALGQFYADNGAYPSEYPNQNDAWNTQNIFLTCVTDRQTTLADKINWGDAFTCGSKTYLAKIPNDPNNTGYYYKIYEWKYSPSYGTAPAGWCQADSVVGHTQLVKRCQHFTLWTTLENQNDPDIQKTLADPICKVAIRYGAIGGDPPYWDTAAPASQFLWNGNGDPSNAMYWNDYWTVTPPFPVTETKGWSYWAWEDPDRSPTPPGSANYCIHD